MTEWYASGLRRDELARRVGRPEQVAGVRLVTLGDDVGRGVRVLEFRTGTGFDFDVVVDRCFDVGPCWFRGNSLAWLASPGVVAPWYAEPLGLGWFRALGGGMVVTCGLDHIQGGGKDSAAHFQQDLQPEIEYGLQGRVGMLPARLIGYGELWQGDQCVLWAEGIVRQAAVFAEALELRRRIEADVGGKSFRIRDSVVNVGFEPTTHMYLYHCNIGYPVLDEAARLLIPATRVAPNPPAVAPQDYRLMTAPQAHFKEELYEHEVQPEQSGIAPVALINDALNIGVYQLYDRRTLPFHTFWRMMGEGNYVVALEPTTNRDAGRFDAKERGELQWLQSGEGRQYFLEIGVLDGEREVTDFEARVKAIQVTS
ncbi:MAG: aldose 1-epimerase family protein [Streptosporangiaceae bacterium]